MISAKQVIIVLQTNIHGNHAVPTLQVVQSQLFLDQR